MIKKSLLAAAILGAVSAVSAQEVDLVVYDTATAVAPTPPGMFPQITSFTGTSSDVTVDPLNYCSGATPQNVFPWGSTIATNSFWTDTAVASTMSYDVTFAVQLPSGGVRVLLQWTATYTGLTPGTSYNFCAAEFTSTPPSGPSGLGFPWGKRVVEVGTADSAQGVLGTITLQ